MSKIPEKKKSPAADQADEDLDDENLEDLEEVDEDDPDLLALESTISVDELADVEEDDPITKEALELIEKPVPKKTSGSTPAKASNQPPSNEGQKFRGSTAQAPPKTSPSAPNSVKTGVASTPVRASSTPIPAAVIKPFTYFLLEKTKYYEEISFDTILRKIPPEWSITNESTIIDMIELILAHGLVTGRMTATSLKFYGYPLPEKPKTK
jgi:hypothetical protein